MIEGVVITPLKQIADERGKVMHMLRSDWKVYEGFGEIYFSCVNPGKVKAWKKHSQMKMNLACVSGNARIVLYDDREGSSTYGLIEELEIGEKNYCLVTIPPEIWNGFAAIEEETAMIANCATIVHQPNESISIEYTDKRIPYEWRK